MFSISEDKTITITRGDCCSFPVTAVIDGEVYLFEAGDMVRFKVFRKKDCATIVIQRDFKVETDTDTVMISLNSEDTKIGKVISKPVEYWYEVELNPDTNPRTIWGYDDDGPKKFTLFPEGKDVDNNDIEVVGSKTLQELVDYALEQANESGAFKGEKGDTGAVGPQGETGPQGPRGEKGDVGNSGVYVGSGEMPEGYNVQIDPDGDTFSIGDIVTEVIAALPNGDEVSY